MKKLILAIIFTLISATAFTIDYWYFPLDNNRAVISTNRETGKESFEKCGPFKFIGLMIPNEGACISLDHGGIRIDIERSPQENKNKAWSFLIFPSKAECEKNYKIYYHLN